MERIQINLTPSEAEGVAHVATVTDRKRSEVIREAIDQYLQRFERKDRREQLRSAAGMWKNRKDMDLEKIRKDFDRF